MHNIEVEPLTSAFYDIVTVYVPDSETVFQQKCWLTLLQEGIFSMFIEIVYGYQG